MVDDDAPPPAVLLTYVIDDINECTQLIRSSGPQERPWWRSFTFGLVRTRAEVVDSLRLLYLTENVDRARERWQEVTVAVDHLAVIGQTDEVVGRLVGELRASGFDAVAAQLQRSELPYSVDQRVTHLNGVAGRMAVISSHMVKARSLLSLGDRSQQAPPPHSR
jgi:hypothetical protein